MFFFIFQSRRRRFRDRFDIDASVYGDDDPWILAFGEIYLRYLAGPRLSRKQRVRFESPYHLLR